MKSHVPLLLTALISLASCEGTVPFTTTHEPLDPRLIERARKESPECAHIVRGDPQIILPEEKSDPWTAKNQACEDATTRFLIDHLDRKEQASSSAGKQSNNSFKPNPQQGGA